MVLILGHPRNLSDEEWRQVLSVFDGHPLRLPLEVMKKHGNRPQKACDLFDDHLVNQYGNEYISNKLRTAKVPFRLTRIGTWMGEKSRKNRLLAVVPWPVIESRS